MRKLANTATPALNVQLASPPLSPNASSSELKVGSENPSALSQQSDEKRSPLSIGAPSLSQVEKEQPTAPESSEPSAKGGGEEIGSQAGTVTRRSPVRRQRSKDFLELRQKFETMSESRTTRMAQTLGPGSSNQNDVMKRTSTLGTIVSEKRSSGAFRLAARRKPLRPRSSSFTATDLNTDGLPWSDGDQKTRSANSSPNIAYKRRSSSWIFADKEPGLYSARPGEVWQNTTGPRYIPGKSSTPAGDSSGDEYVDMSTMAMTPSPDLTDARRPSAPAPEHDYVNTPSPVTRLGDDEDGYAVMGRRQTSEDDDGYSAASDLLATVTPRSTPDNLLRKVMTPIERSSGPLPAIPSALANITSAADFDSMTITELQALATADNIPFSVREAAEVVRERIVRHWKDLKGKSKLKRKS